MAERGFRHVVVMVDGRAAGCVSDGDLFAFARLGVPAISSAVRNAPDLPALTRAAGQVRELTRDLGQQAMPAEQLTRMVATLNDLVTIRALELVADDCGIARDGYCWLAFGSEGRHEQTFATDQDNGLVFHPPVDGDIESVRSAFIRFARRVNEALAQCGFPLCHGEVMAGNPRWCLTLVEWQAAFGTWLRTPDAESLLHASIFFDMRPLYGDLALGTALRDWLSATSSGHTVFLRLLAENALQREAPLGLLRDFVVEDHGGRTGTIDLKTNGAALFVDAARVLSLAAGDTHAGTAARLRAVAEQRQLARTEVDAWLDAFHFVQRLRVEHQLRCLAEGRATENYVAPDDLNALDRRILKEALRQGRKLQERLRLDFRL
jgi:CBS domain-containing protein